MLGNLHQILVSPRRIRIISEAILSRIPEGSTVLDLGCGDGAIGELLSRSSKGLKVQGMEVVVRSQSKLPCTGFDGVNIPLADRSVDVVLLIDVLHHSEQPERLLCEAMRVAREMIILKDHLLQGRLGKITLSLMDLVGNQYSLFKNNAHYLKPEEWDSLFTKMEFRVDRWQSNLNLYPWPSKLVFERNYHFMARLIPKDGSGKGVFGKQNTNCPGEV